MKYAVFKAEKKRKRLGGSPAICRRLIGSSLVGHGAKRRPCAHSEVTPSQLLSLFLSCPWKSKGC
jgi:hypothetical protein